MRRTLLIAACSLFLAGTQAFAADQQKWSKSVENTVSKWEELNLQAPTAVDNAGNTYATGAFTQPIVIGSAVLDPIANSAYLAKYDAEGNVAWLSVYAVQPPLRPLPPMNKITSTWPAHWPMP